MEDEENGPVNDVLNDIGAAAGGVATGIGESLAGWGTILKWALVAAALYFLEKKTGIFRGLYYQLRGIEPPKEPAKETESQE